MLSNIANIGIVGTGTTPSMKNKEFYDSKDIMFIKPSDIFDTSITEIVNAENYISNKARLKAKIFPKDTILCVCIGSIGKIGITTQESSCNQQINYIIPNNNHYPKFIAYNLYYNKQRLIDIGSDGPVVPIINKKKFEEICIKIFDYSTEKEIADSLDIINRYIELKQNELKSLNELIKSRFIEMFVNSEFDKIQIRKLVDTKKISAKKMYKSHDEIKYIDISSIDNQSNLIVGNTKYIFEKAPSRAQQCLKKNDILISTVRPNLKNIAIFTEDGDGFVGSSGFCVLRATECNYQYLKYVVLDDDFTNAMIKLTNGANYPAVRDDDVLNYETYNAPIELQNQFASFVEQIDKLKFVDYSKYFLCDIFTLFSSTIAYSSVVSILACPNIFCTCSIGIPLSIAFVANVRRNLCGCIFIFSFLPIFLKAISIPLISNLLNGLNKLTNKAFSLSFLDDRYCLISSFVRASK